ncbi:hypothetical protein BBC27_12825 [Acidithiobacillus ferrivorans]|uniref:Uncharacterized protein n=1 Tax=Acidithiobacillus ferrivorans TaxID=160808 RepID=A0A1B9BXT2_9PROT|nr:hypothetical protein [Acidithiobacillus ferrivorans]OCB02519.1 hypothetical protein BBC27_12825 [Acidithiobacillus ferrivorans]
MKYLIKAEIDQADLDFLLSQDDLNDMERAVLSLNGAVIDKDGEDDLDGCLEELSLSLLGKMDRDGSVLLHSEPA